jgi:hypothetical protein
MNRLGVRLRGGSLLVVLCLLVPPAFADGFKFGVRGGYYSKVEEPFAGAELLVPVSHRFYFNPNVEYVFVKSGSYVTFNGDFHYDFHHHRSTYAWVGGGLAVVRVDPEGPANADSSVAANFLAGIGFRAGSVIPYFQAKVVAKSDSLVSLAFGFRF